ncbi:MAG: AmmeMemoRadiSam system protein A [Gammaproteobacteria bacterium]|nr:AmmeMemoRadiSam system protein A [Gammaproteobacteria bacterium]
MPSTESLQQPLAAADRSTLLKLAADSIRVGLESRSPLRVQASVYSDALQRTGACFVTLKLNGNLRGCIGHLEAHQPLVADVAENAFSAAFRDPRFAPLRPQELESLEIEISILSSPQPLPIESEQDLARKLRPGIDGLILQIGGRRATFLPSVWESLPTARDFIAQLKRKAGFASDFWSDQVRAWTYQSQSISAAD